MKRANLVTVRQLICALIQALILLAVPGVSAFGEPRPVYFHLYCHLEEITNIEDGHAYIEKVFRLCKKYGIKFEANFHRYMSVDIRDRSPELLELIKSSDWTLSYHPHPIRHLMPKYPEDERFDDRVKRYIEHHSSYLDWSKGEIVKGREGAIPLMEKVFGKKVMMECHGPHDAVASYALKRHFDIPVRLGGKGSLLGPQKQYTYNDFLGRYTYLYWYMDNLFIKTPGYAAHAFRVDSNDLKRTLRDLPPDRMHIVSITTGSDKASMMSHNALINRQWKPGSKRLEDFPIPEYQRDSDERIKQFWDALEETLRFLSEEYLPAHPRSRIVTADEMIQMVEPEIDRPLTRRQVAQAADYILQTWEARPPLYVDVGDEPISDADAFQALWISLAHYERNGSLPETVKIGGLVGPIGEQDELPRRGGGDLLDPKALLATVAANPLGERVPYVLTVGKRGPALNAAQWLYVLAYLYRDLNELGHAEPVRTPGRTFILPMGAEWESAGWPRIQEELDRGTWYELLQFWTVKPTRVKAENL